MRTRTRLYVGIRRGGEREIFRSAATPTERTHGDRFVAVIGPFRTKGGAEVMSRATQAPLIVNVAAAERSAARSRGQSELCRDYAAHLDREIWKGRGRS